MSKLIQLRDVPEEMHRRIEALAASEGLSVGEFLLREINRVMETAASEQDMRDGLARLPRHDLSPSPTELLREERDRR